jgi:CubicO group peptidase (beta-lactamase class C family)
VLSPRTVEFMTSDHLGSLSRGTGFTGWPGYTGGLGVAVRHDKGIAPIPGSPGAFYWPAAFATYWWADPKEELVVVFMTLSQLGRHYQHLIRGLVYQAIAT